jgi:hypothetical protein
MKTLQFGVDCLNWKCNIGRFLLQRRLYSYVLEHYSLMIPSQTIVSDITATEKAPSDINMKVSEQGFVIA